MLKLAIREVKTHLRRFIVTIISVLLGVAFLSGTLSLRDSLASGLSGSFSFGRVYDVLVQGKKITGTPGFNVRTDIPLTIADKIKQVPGVKQALPVDQLYVSVFDKTERPLNRAGLFNSLITATPQFPKPKIIGAYPQGSTQVAVEAGALNRLGLKIGDELALGINGQIKHLKIVGRVEYDEPIQILNLYYIDSQEIRNLVPNPQLTMSFCIQINPGYKAAQVAHNLEKQIGSAYQVYTGEAKERENKDNLNQQLGFITTFLLVFVIVALAVSVFIIANTFNMVVKARQKEFAYLRAIGVSPWQVFTSIAIQGALVGIIGSLLGLLIGFGILKLASWVLDYYGLLLGLQTQITLRVAIISVLIGVLVTVLGSLAPARHAAQSPPVEAMREVSGVREKSVWPRFLSGILLILIGGIGLYLGTHPERDFAGSALAAGSAGLIFGVVVGGPGIVKILLGLLSWPCRKVKSVSLRLGIRNALRNPRRTAATGGALIISMGLVSAGLVLADSLRLSSQEVIDNELNFDLMALPLNGQDTISDELFNELSRTPGVKETISMQIVILPIMTSLDSKPQVMLSASSEMRLLPRGFRMKLTAGSINDLSNGGLAIPKAMAESAHLKIGQKIWVQTASQQVETTIKAIQDSSLSMIMLDDSQISSFHAQSLGRLRVLIDLDPSFKLSQVKAALQEKIPAGKGIAVMDKEELKGYAAKMVGQALAVVYALVGLSLVVAALGIINTLGLSVAERIREIGIARAIGISRISISFTIAVESILTALYGAIIGMGLGIAIAASLVKYLGNYGIKVLSIPLNGLLIVLVAAVLAGLIAALGPGWRAARKPVLEAIAS